jgi:hypothetical protein
VNTEFGSPSPSERRSSAASPRLAEYRVNTPLGGSWAAAYGRHIGREDVVQTVHRDAVPGEEEEHRVARRQPLRQACQGQVLGRGEMAIGANLPDGLTR